MPNITFSEARVKALRPRLSAYDIRDAKLRGFGVRVLPSGDKRFFVHTQHRGARVWKMVGDASAMTVDEARTRAASLLAAIRCGADAPTSPDATRFETVAKAVFRRYARVWKPHANTVRESELPAPTDSAPARRYADCRHHPCRRAALVRLAPGHPRRRRPFHAPSSPSS